MDILKNKKVIILGVALVLVVAGMYFKIDVPAAIDSLSAVAGKLGALTTDPAPAQ